LKSIINIFFYDFDFSLRMLHKNIERKSPS